MISDFFRNIATQRQSGHWVANNSVPEDLRRTRFAVFESIAVAAQLLNLQQEHETGFEFADPSIYVQEVTKTSCFAMTSCTDISAGTLA